MTNHTDEELASGLRAIAAWGGHGSEHTAILMEAALRLQTGTVQAGVRCERHTFMGGCEGPVSTREDLYAREINNRPGELVTLCEYHHQDLADAI